MTMEVHRSLCQVDDERKIEMNTFKGNLAVGCGTGFSITGDMSGWDMQDNVALNCDTGWDIAPQRTPIPDHLIEAIKGVMEAGAPKDAVVQTFGSQLGKYGMNFAQVVGASADAASLIQTLIGWG